MVEQFKKYLKAVQEFWTGAGKKTKRILVSALVLIVGLAVVMAVLLNSTKYTVLYPNLDAQEALAVIAELKERNIPYKEKNGTVYVPTENENAVRMELANEGYPKSAPNYDFFLNNVDMLTTDYEKKIIEKYQMNQRLEAVIETFDAVKDASVTINLADSSSYAWDKQDQNKTTVAVAVTLYPGKTLEPAQVNGIKQLISKSLPNLQPEDVAVINTATSEELVASSSKDKTAVEISEFKSVIEREYQSEIQNSIYEMLVPLYGKGNVKVIAKAVMDVDKKVKEIITYLPSEDNKGVVGREDTVREEQKNGKGNGGVAGEEPNTDTGYTGVTTDGDTIYLKDQKSYDYLVSQVKESIQSDAAALKDMTVAVVVNKGNMTDQEREEIAKLAAFSAAVSTEKVAVYGTKFFTPEEEEKPVVEPGIETWVLATAAGVGALMLLVILLLVVRLRRRRVEEEEEEYYEEDDFDDITARIGAQKLAEEEAARAEKVRLMEELHAKKQNSEDQMRKSLQDFSSQNPEIVAQLIKAWLRGEDVDV